MSFSKGDKIIIKQTKETGEIIKIIDDLMVEVQVLNTRFPAYFDELELPNQELFTSKKMNAKKKALSLDDFLIGTNQLSKERQTKLNEDDLGFFLYMLPVYYFDAHEEHVGRIKLYFINQTEYNISIKYNCHTNLGKEFGFASTLYPFSHLFLHQIKFDLINEGLVFDIIINQADSNNTINQKLKIKAKQIFQRLLKMQENNESFFQFEIEKDFPIIDLSQLKDGKLFSGISKPSNVYQYKNQNKVEREIDLHVETLLDNFKQLTAHQILEAQLMACEQAIDNAFNAQRPSIIIIHGIGGGKLKEEIHKLLKLMKKQVRQFENKYSHKYGFGATEVFLRY
ncbi:MAG TPA: Smr/MutS family protein [Edaphocola sp.]|nr:Smr/MutS family protein [Edaphocola sp.]